MGLSASMPTLTSLACSRLPARSNMPSRAHDDVVEDPDAEERARPSEPAEHLMIGPARRGIPARMVVRDDETCRVGQDRRLEHFARVHGRGVERAYRHDVEPKRSVARRE